MDDKTNVLWSDLLLPEAVLEAGDEHSGGLMAALRRSMSSMPMGGILEVESSAAGAHADITAWCRVEGDRLIGLLVMGDRTRFWLQKRSLP
jgi:TusA-related sulfurtransferase